MEFVGFRADEVVAGPSMSGPSQLEAEAEAPVMQTAPPPLTPELRPVIVPESVPVPVVRLPQVVEQETAHDSDSDTTIVAGDYWDADLRRHRNEVLSQETSASQEHRQQAYRYVPQQQPNEQSSLLRPQTQSTEVEPRAKPQLRVPATRTGYGTLDEPSSSRPHATEIAMACLRARALIELADLERKRPWHTRYSQLSLPFRFDFVFFGTSSPHARARARAFAEEIASVRVRTALLRQFSSGLSPVGGRSGLDEYLYGGMITRSQARDVEVGI